MATPQELPIRWTGRDGTSNPYFGHKGVDQRTLDIIERSAVATLGQDFSHILVRSGGDDHSRNHGRGQNTAAAVDVYFVMGNGETLKWNDPRYKALTIEMANRGAQQFGLGNKYMGNDGLHVGVGTPGRDGPNNVRVWNDSDPGGTSYVPPGTKDPDAYLREVYGQSSAGVTQWKNELQQAFSNWRRHGIQNPNITTADVSEGAYGFRAPEASIRPQPRGKPGTPLNPNAGGVGAPLMRGVQPIVVADSEESKATPAESEAGFGGGRAGGSTETVSTKTYRPTEVVPAVRQPDPLTTQAPTVNRGGPMGFGSVDPDGPWGPVMDLFGISRPSNRSNVTPPPQPQTQSRAGGQFSQPPSAYYQPTSLPDGTTLLNPGQFDVGENDTYNAPPAPTKQWVDVPEYDPSVYYTPSSPNYVNPDTGMTNGEMSRQQAPATQPDTSGNFLGGALGDLARMLIGR